jgi:3-isopropylmalate/(R)-2-methylmalate dehydratase small subunit
LHDYGFRVLIAPSFGDIFYNNSCKNGLLPVELAAAAVAQLFREVAEQPGYRLKVDLSAQIVTTPTNQVFKFDIEPLQKHRLLSGLDEIGLTLQHVDKIKMFEVQHRERQPWLFSK